MLVMIEGALRFGSSTAYCSIYKKRCCVTVVMIEGAFGWPSGITADSPNSSDPSDTGSLPSSNALL